MKWLRAYWYYRLTRHYCRRLPTAAEITDIGSSFSRALTQFGNRDA